MHEEAIKVLNDYIQKINNEKEEVHNELLQMSVAKYKEVEGYWEDVFEEYDLINDKIKETLKYLEL